MQYLFFAFFVTAVEKWHNPLRKNLFSVTQPRCL